MSQSLDAFSRSISVTRVWRPGFSAPPEPLAAVVGWVLLLRRRGGKGRMDREGNRRELPPLYLTSGYGPDVALVQTMLSIQHVLLKPE